MLHSNYYVELDKYNKLINRKNVKADSYNGVYDRYVYPVLTREHIPLTWKYDPSFSWKVTTAISIPSNDTIPFSSFV